MATDNLGRAETELSRLLNRRLRSVLLPMDVTPSQVTAIYLVFGFLALYFSDVYLPRMLRDPAFLRQIQALKGGLELLVSAGVIFGLTYRSRQTLKQKNERLEVLQTERSIIHRVFRHNLRQDINLVLGNSDFIQSSTDDERIIERCENLVERMSKIERYQRQMSQIEEVLDPSTPLRRTNLSTVVTEDSLVDELAESSTVSLTIDVPEETEVIASKHFSEGFHEVLENSIEHHDSDTPKVEVSIEESERGMVELSVTDDGPGIPEYEQQAISQMEEEQMIHSSGLGLWLAKFACVRSGGDLEISTPSHGGSRVTMALPKASSRVIKRKLFRVFR